MLDTMRIIARRRSALAQRLDPARNRAALEESCVPSYCHPNLLAASVAWWRLVKVAALCRASQPGGPLLDFGSATGEVAHLLGGVADYHFIEADEALAGILLEWNPQARRQDLALLPRRHYRTILALDSLEHNEDIDSIIRSLAESLRDDGTMIVSGPTESRIYRLGRRIAGFDGHYHKQTVYDVESAMASVLELERVVRIPPIVPLFRISVWHRPAARFAARDSCQRCA
jgi:hypothetical protein